MCELDRVEIAEAMEGVSREAPPRVRAAGMSRSTEWWAPFPVQWHAILLPTEKGSDNTAQGGGRAAAAAARIESVPAFSLRADVCVCINITILLHENGFETG